MSSPHTLCRAGVFAALALLALTGCTNEVMSGIRNGGRPAFDGQYFRAKLTANPEDPRAFTVAVAKPEKSLTGAREAARYEGVQHCIKYYGDSVITWAVGPDSPPTAMVMSENGMLFSGMCRGW
tara:strand:- start:541 stop:912 length:372 start_codon:yes stop_codon:yes gene_type:complete